MRDAGLFRIMQPAIYGGYEYGFDALVPVVAAVAAGCGSAGWVFSLGVVHQWLVATIPKEAQDEYWAEPDAIAAGSYRAGRQGRARSMAAIASPATGASPAAATTRSGCSSAA